MVRRSGIGRPAGALQQCLRLAPGRFTLLLYRGALTPGDPDTRRLHTSTFTRGDPVGQLFCTSHTSAAHVNRLPERHDDDKLHTPAYKRTAVRLEKVVKTTGATAH